MLDEPEGAALRRWLAGWPDRLSSELAAIELSRVVRRRRPELLGRLDAVLSRISLRPMTDDVVLLSGLVEPAALRTLDAIHVATAVLLREAIGCFVTYDEQQAAAARAAGLPVASPY
jgi:uncharacterized protein